MVINEKHCDENENENGNNNENDNNVVYIVGVLSKNGKSRRFEIL